MRVNIKLKGKSDRIPSLIETEARLINLFKKLPFPHQISDIELNTTQSRLTSITEVDGIHISFICRIEGNVVESNQDTLVASNFLNQHRNALNLVKGFTVVETQIVEYTYIPAIEENETSVFTIDRFFADKCGKSDEYCRQLLNNNTKVVLVEYEPKTEALACATGNLSMVADEGGKKSFDGNNPYHCFAGAILKNPGIKWMLTETDVTGVHMRVSQYLDVEIAVSRVNSFKVNLSSMSSVNNVVRLARQTSPVLFANPVKVDSGNVQEREVSAKTSLT